LSQRHQQLQNVYMEGSDCTLLGDIEADVNRARFGGKPHAFGQFYAREFRAFWLFLRGNSARFVMCNTRGRGYDGVKSTTAFEVCPSELGSNQ
jgi:hypothetical protein